MSELDEAQQEEMFRRTGLRYVAVQDGIHGVGISRRERRKQQRAQAKRLRKGQRP